MNVPPKYLARHWLQPLPQRGCIEEVVDFMNMNSVEEVAEFGNMNSIEEEEVIQMS